MLTIRPSQVAVLEEQKLKNTAHDLAIILRKKHPRVFQFYTDQQLVTWTINQLRYLKALDINTDDSINRIINLLAIFGAQFERCTDAQWALDIIEKENFDADQKAALLCNEAQKQLNNGNLIM